MAYHVWNGFSIHCLQWLVIWSISLVMAGTPQLLGCVCLSMFLLKVWVNIGFLFDIDMYFVFIYFFFFFFIDDLFIRWCCAFYLFVMLFIWALYGYKLPSDDIAIAVCDFWIVLAINIRLCIYLFNVKVVCLSFVILWLYSYVSTKIWIVFGGLLHMWFILRVVEIQR